MKIATYRAVFVFFLFCFILFPTMELWGQNKNNTDSGDPWVSAYLASWKHQVPPENMRGNLPATQISWQAVTHLFYFAFNVKANGSLSQVGPTRNLTSTRIRSIVSAAHKNGKPVLFTIGGWGNHAEFSQAIGSRTRGRLVSNLLKTLTYWGFDGIDLDLEPIKDEDLSNYRAFIEELYQELQNSSTRKGSVPLLTVATNGQPDFFADLHTRFDQINLMTYDFSGAWEGWVSWHNSPVYSAEKTFPGSDRLLPSVDKLTSSFITAGVPPSKLGIGIDFYGYTWSGGSGTPDGGITRPDQRWDTPPAVTDNVPYHTIMEQYFGSASYHWDDSAKAAWLSIDLPGSRNDKFISFDDERSIRAKFDYVKKNQLGGVIIWELGGGYRRKQPAGRRDLLLKHVYDMIRE